MAAVSPCKNTNAPVHDAPLHEVINLEGTGDETKSQEFQVHRFNLDANVRENSFCQVDQTADPAVTLRDVESKHKN